MRMKKTWFGLAGGLFFLLALQLLLSGRAVSAASISASDIEVDYGWQRMTIRERTNTDQQIQVALATVKRTRTKQKDENGAYVYRNVISVSRWDSYDYTSSGVTVDLSYLNRSKDNYLQIKGDRNQDAVTVKIPAVIRKVAVSSDVEAKEVVMKDVTNRKEPKVLNQAMEYRTAYSDWHTYQKGEDLSMYQVNGATLYFRLCADATANVGASKDTQTDLYDKSGNTVEAKVLGRFPGIEVKLKIKKQANGPRAIADYLKQQFVLPKRSEYRVVTGEQMSAWKSSGSDETSVRIDLSSLRADIGNAKEAVLEVRTRATDTRICSKIYRIPFTMPDALATCYVVDGFGQGPAEPDGDIFDNAVGDGCAEEQGCTHFKLYMGYRYRESNRVMTGIRFWNSTADTYEVFVSRDGASPQANSRLYTIKAKSRTASRDAETTIATPAVKNGDKIYVRKKGNTKNKVFASDFVCLGVVSWNP